jgi:hypothetical protein
VVNLATFRSVESRFVLLVCFPKKLDYLSIFGLTEILIPLPYCPKISGLGQADDLIRFRREIGD